MKKKINSVIGNRPISGEEIMQLYNLPPSREVGILKNALRDAILDGLVENNYESAKIFLDMRFKEINF